MSTAPTPASPPAPAHGAPDPRPGGRLATATALALALGVALTAGVARWPLPDARAFEAVATQIARSTGVAVTAAGVPSLRLLPRPTIEIGGVSFRSADHSVAADAERMWAVLDLAALAGGNVRLARLRLRRPTIAIDADRVTAFAELVRGEAMPRLGSLLQTGGLTVEDAVVRIVSTDPAVDSVLTEVSATFAWPAGAEGASLRGRATWRGHGLSVAADLDRPEALLGGGDAQGSVSLRSDTVDIGVIATLSYGASRSAIGRIEASTPHLSDFLQLIGHPAPQLGGIERARLDGRLTADADVLSISDATVALDDMQFEGALAIRRKDDRLALAATLATDRIDLGRFLGELPSLTAPDGSWTTRPLATASIADDEIDLRVSAAHATLGPFRIEDSSLSLQSGSGRLELSLGEARAYDGLLKARVVAETQGATTLARLDAALSRIDLGKLLKDAGRPVCTGILTGHVGLEARGSSPAALARTGQGRGAFTLRDGELDPSAGSVLLGRATEATPPPGVGSAFDDLAAGFRIARGDALLQDSWVTWPAARATLSGSASLRNQSFDLAATFEAPSQGDETVGFRLRGPWRDLRLVSERPTL